MGCPSLGIISLGLTEGNIMLDFICIYNSIHKFSLKLFHFLKKVAKKKISTKYPVQRNKIPRAQGCAYHTIFSFENCQPYSLIVKCN